MKLIIGKQILYNLKPLLMIILQYLSCGALCWSETISQRPRVQTMDGGRLKGADEGMLLKY